MNTKQTIINNILKQVSLPLFYHDNAETSVEIVRALYKAGLCVIEFTNRGKFALENFRYLKELQSNELPDLVLGIGTIKTKTEALDFIQAGADFIVAPVVDAGVAQVTAEHNLLWIPGCMTPTEIHTASNLGASLIKIFPANIFGPGFILAIRELFPSQQFLATGWGDITEENIRCWLQSGVQALGLGSKLITNDIMENSQFDELYNRAIEVTSYLQKIAINKA